ncbi:DUF4349 domain-containing protein [Chryseobacterium populi]|uniref:DUF4349 domain-containing protein n=1 Tax=Chryseobacterium populi TaxID=1144316 RepID=J2JXT9_9FLAO|nr:DUF4349 domain-containing protein [Chryseobacterium populi]EJL72700.1 hypothetical protein PMI13_01847 [Chryseobacterium populi]
MRNVILLLFAFFLIQCNKSENQHEIKADLAEVLREDKIASPTAIMDLEAPSPPNKISEKPVSDNQQSSSKKIDPISKKIIKNGEMTIQVGDIKKAQSLVGEILKKNQAYIQTEKFNNIETEENLNLIIRVPHQNFDALINSFSNGVGSVLSKNISSNDVTEEYTDVSIKLANKKIYLEKYRDMLKSASTTKDILEIQENIRELEDEIDISEGRLRFIDDKVKYSTLNLNLYKEKVRSSATSKIGFGNRFGDSLTEGWNTFVGFMLGLVSLWPFLLVIPLFIFLWRKWKFRRKK